MELDGVLTDWTEELKFAYLFIFPSLPQPPANKKRNWEILNHIDII